MKSYLVFGLSLAGLVALGPARGFAADDNSDLQRQLADAQDKLSTSLRSYGLLEDENTKLKAQIDKEDADKAALQEQLAADEQTIANLKSAAQAATQLDPLRTQLRQTLEQLAQLAQENYQLKTRLALQGPPPSAPATRSRTP